MYKGKIMKKHNLLSQAIKLALFSGLTVSSTYALANEEVEKKGQEAEEVETIEVTGSRIRKIDLEPTQPITVVDSEYISDRGLTNAITAITELPGVFAGATPVVASNTGASNSGVGQNIISIYGLGSQRTLTLVNGGRFVSSNSTIGGAANSGSQVDVNNIPVALIDKVEVVKAGGAPVYGADAVSGVVNYILKKDYEGAEFSFDYRNLDGYGDETSFKALIGGNFAEDKGNVVFSMEHNKTDHIPMREVPYLYKDYTNQKPLGDDKVVDPATGEAPSNQRRLYPNPRAGILSFSGLVTPGSTALTNFGLGMFGDGNFYQFDPAGTGNLVAYDAGTALNSAVWSSGGDGLDLARTNTAQEGYERYNLTMISNYKLTDDINLNITAFANSAEAANPGYQAAMYNSGIWNGSDGGALVFNTSHPFLTTQARDILEAEVGEDGDFYYHRGWINLGAREVENESSVRSIRATLEGSFEFADRDFDWNVSYQEGQSSIFSKSNGISLHRFWAAMDVGINPATGAVDCKYNYEDGYGEDYRASGHGLEADDMILGEAGKCAPLNPFGTVSDEAKDYVSYNDLSRSLITQKYLTAYIAGDIMELPAGSLSFAAGYESRTEGAKYAPDASAKLQGLPDATINGEYTTDDMFLELYIPLVDESMDIPLFYSLSMETSFRSMDNSSAGSDTAWAVGVTYRPFEDLSLKANAAETVRAPAISELFQPRLKVTSFAADPCHVDYLGDGPAPDVRQANCAAEGIPTDFQSDAVIASRGGFSGGNDSLLNERATTTNFGILYAPSWFEGLNLAVDYVEISMEDAIVEFSLTEIMEACYDGTDYPNRFCTMFTRRADHQLPVNDAFTSGFVNAALREFEGVEYAASFERALSEYPLIGGLFPETAGSFGIKATAFNLMTDAESNTGFDFEDNVGQYTDPEWRTNVTITHRTDDVTTYLGMVYRGEGARNLDATSDYQYLDVNGKPVTTVDGYAVWNFGTTYKLNDTFTLRARIDNLTNWKPDSVQKSLDFFQWGTTYNLGVTAKF